MSVKKVFLIKPAYRDSYYKYNDLPAGLGYISQALLDNGIDNAVCDMHLKKDKKSLFSAIEAYGPALIGLSLMSYRFKEHYSLIREIKEKFPSIPIVAGGPHVSTFREKVLQECEDLDFGVVLEGDLTIVELCGNLNSPEAVKGVLYRRNGAVFYTGDRPFIQDLNALGFPKYERFEIERYEVINIITSRGCPYKCIYCPVARAIGSHWRYRSAVSIVDELEFWHNKEFFRLDIEDDNFTLLKPRVEEVCDLIKSRGLNKLNLGLGNGIRADKVDKQLLLRLKQAGFSYVSFGVEAASNKVLERLKKGETIEDIERAISNAIDVGLPVELFFLLGSPSETEEDVKQSVKLTLKYPVIDAAFYNILPFPYTELHSYLMEKKAFLKDPEAHLNDSSHWIYDPVFETPELSKKDRIRLLKWANGTAKRHTDRVRLRYRVQRLKGAGVPGPIAFIIAKTSRLEFLKMPFRKFGLVQMARKALGIKY